MTVEVADRQELLRVDPGRLRRETESLARAAGFRGDLSLALVTDAEIEGLNRRFLGHEGPTDVITFPLDAGEAEIVVSVERAVAEAEDRGVEPLAELMLYVVHGILHLAGHDDADEASSRAMNERGLELLRPLGYENRL